MSLVSKILKEGYLPDVYYHGTSSEQAALQILEKGLVPGVPVDDRKKGHMLKPVAGRVYLTKSLGYALIYCIGGDMAGHKVPEHWLKESRYGYLFKSKEIDEDKVQPDEDEVGELIEKIPELNRIAKGLLTPNQYRKAMDGELMYQAQAGKKLLKLIPKNSKIWDLVRAQSDNIAHEGTVEIMSAWKIDKALCEQLKKDGSNFFEFAEQVL